MTMPGMLMRSKLFVPGTRPELFAKALASAADAVSIDLEDAVPQTRKAEARAAAARFLRSVPPASPGKLIVVRVNALATAHFAPDLDAVVWPGVDVVNLPKAESADDIGAAAAALGRQEAERGIARPIGLLATIESPRGLRLAAEIATASPRIVGLQLGFADLFEPLGIDRQDATAVRQVQLAVRFAAGEAGIAAYDAAFAAVTDPAGYRREAERARRLGYSGKSCIHPGQVAIANEVFRPSDAEIAHALRVLEAARAAEDTGVGAFVVDGKMVDAPFVERSRAIVALARRLGLGGL